MSQLLRGAPVSRGVAVGPVFRYAPFVPTLSQDTLADSDIEAALRAYDVLRETTDAELQAIRDALVQHDPDKAKIFTAHIDILYDEVMDEEIRASIGEGTPIDRSIAAVYGSYAKLLAKAKDPLIRERAADLRDVMGRLLRVFAGAPDTNLSTLSRPVIVAAHDLLPSDTATLNRANVLAIVTEVGGETSHSAIIAKSYEIPALLGVPGALAVLRDGETAIVDALEGKLIVEPEEEERAEYAARQEKWRAQQELLRVWRDAQPVCRSGERVSVLLNIGAATKEELEAARYADGVGLFRTEFLYMGRDTLPTEQEQYETYCNVLRAFGDKPVTLRTLDIGGDKKLPCLELPEEENPFLGRRALRLCLSLPDVFQTQLRAALRAGLHGNLRIMFPMVGSLDDIQAAKAAVERAKQSLRDEGVAFCDTIPLGIMIEIPSIAFLAREVAESVDFGSIGTNDLCQYMLAVDRMNPEISGYYQSYHPALFRAVQTVVSAFNDAGKDICICGELGGDRLAAAALIGMGMRSLSMGAASVARCKKTICALTLAQMQALAAKALRCATADALENALETGLSEVVDI